MRSTSLYLAVASALSLAGCSPQSVQTAKRESVPVTVAKAVERAAPLSLRLIGAVEPYATVAVKAQVAGQVMEVGFHEGQQVRKGDLLFRIDPRPFENALRQAEANVTRDLAQQRQAEANLARDVAQVKTAEQQASRYARLAKEGVVSKEQSDAVRTNADVLEESVRAGRAAIDSLRATLASDRAAVETAKLQLEYCTIRAAIDGRTGNLLVNQGNLVKANDDTPMVVIHQVNPIYVSFSAPQQQLDEIRRHQADHPLDVEVLQENQPIARGKLTFVDHSVDRTTGTIKLKATFANAEQRLWPGRFVNVVVTLAVERAVTMVPSEAIQTGQKGVFAFVVKPDSTVEMRKIAAGRIVGKETVVEEGVRPGETVVTDGHLRLVPGAKVDVVSP